ncbi:glycine--tRNA ligase subunit beta [Arcobacter sp. FWKO B]|uniref:glycine--tRNA ligase subunit beta n=1 Tax=Arcobacter sp. FWKO B TaxID=2593672 RepID=UPI0018A53E4A|nr:glycine--tRNA ligase subunit beta [Arcobacter sp. FWKO B]QOG13187.1 glycine--tRNA ligase subunit beta [Arcobacter sp. FWKO B]
MIKPLLIEIHTEELPAIPFLKELPNIEKKWADILEKNSLLCEFEFFYTPRRIVFWHREFKTKQEDTVKELFGAPVAIAYKDGVATPAAVGFANKCGVSVEELKTIMQNGKEVLYFNQSVEGKASSEILNEMVNEFIKSLNFGKSMRWGSFKESFIRPIKSLSIMLGEEIIDGELFGIKSSNFTYGHRMIGYDKVSFDFAGDYFCKISKAGVILDQDERRKQILETIAKLESSQNIKVEVDEDLLDEVVAITEYPTALLGTFDEEFLVLPPEVIITSMKEHQRYFAVYKDGKLSNNFCVVTNANTDNFSKIISGNEKVLKPRLSDAMFFYKNDLQRGLDTSKLSTVLFADGLGSLQDKSDKEVKVGVLIADKLNFEQKDKVIEAIKLAKADLMSEMVYEFTELQGLMGYYYAKELGLDDNIALALKEQYLPDGFDSKLPSNLFCAIVALSNKIDTILGLFSIGKIPTGTKDPYALRRAAFGVIKIMIEYKLPLDLEDIIHELSYLYKGLDKKQVLEFFEDRLLNVLNVNPSILKAVLATNEKNIYNISQKVSALDIIVNSSDFKDISSTFKRVANIIKDIDTSSRVEVNEDLFEQDEEKELFVKYNDIISKEYSSVEEHLDALFSIKTELDNFFDRVFVNHDNLNIRQNRKNLITLIYNAFKNIADIKEITI